MINNKNLLGLAAFASLQAVAQTQTADVGSMIVGGSETVPYSRPYQVALLMNGRQGCGGTLISKDWVLTAAHCLDNASTSSLQVRVGAHSIRQNDGQTLNVSQIINHEYWRGANNIRSGYDIALLRLATPASSQYKPAKLPTAAIEQNYANVGDAVTVSGWGLTYYQGSPSDVLREVNLPVISNNSCSSELRFNLPSSVVCGGGAGGVSACNGDSGGPYAVKVGSDFYSIGTVSWGQGCRGATAFTRTTSYLDWIKQKTGIGTDTPVDEVPTANFNYSVNGTQVSFNSTSTDDKGAVSHQWQFGDGATSTATSPSHDYVNPGSYTVTLTVTDSVGQTDTIAKSVTIADIVNPPGCDGIAAWSAVTAYALGDVVSYNGRKYQATWWSTGAQPDVYSNVWQDQGECSGSGTDTPPVADFSYVASGLTVSFNEQAQDDLGVVSYSWQFGDGNAASSANPVHTFASSGIYSVALTVVDAKGQTDRVVKSITVSTDNNSGCQGVASWNESTVYLTGDQVALNGRLYTAKWWVQGENPETSGPWGPWQNDGACR